MPTLIIYGGSFPRGVGWYYPNDRFLLRDANSRLERIPVNRLAEAGIADEVSLKAAFGAASDQLAPAFEEASTHMADDDRVVFFARFTDGRTLIAATDGQTLEKLAQDGRARSP